MNHSPHFWEMVAGLVPDYRQRRHGLNALQGRLRCRQSRHRLGVTNRMRDDDALDRPSNIGLCRELERIVSMLLHNNGDLIAIGSRRARLASGSKKRCRQPPARCGQGPVSCKVCRTCYFSIDRLNACLRKGGGFRPFRGDAHQKLRRLPNTYTACTRPRTVRHSSFQGEKTGSSSGPSITSGWIHSTNESCKCNASCTTFSARRSTRFRSAGNGHDTNIERGKDGSL